MQFTLRSGRIVRPHVYRKKPGLYRWRLERDSYGWLWIDLGHYVFTTSP